MDSKQLRELIEARRFRFGRQNASSVAGRVSKEVTSFHWFAIQFGVACWWIWHNVLYPVSRPLRTILVAAWNWYRRLWDRVVYYKDEFDVTHFGKARAGMMVMATVFMIYVIPSVIGLTFDTGMYFATVRHHEVVVLQNSQELDSVANVHSAMGWHTPPYDEQHSIYYRIRSTWFNELWSLLHRQNFFFADYVAAAVPTVPTECVVTSYGIRLKLFMRILDFYPDLLSVSCDLKKSGL